MFSWFKKTPSVSTNKEKIDEILTRGVERHYPNEEFLRKKLTSGKRLKIFLGIDPTGPTLHLGHAIPLRKLQQLQNLGHEIVLLIGDFTARIGDPDKKEVRKQLTHTEVLKNAKLYKEQAATFLRFHGTNPAKVVFNNDWLGKLTFADVVELASKMTVQQMLERDMFRKRIQEEKPIYLHEFLYPLMQGYDSIAMDVDGEVGGNDQTFNMLAGRTLLKETNGKEKFVIPMKLLVDTTGAKMGKTTGNMLSFLDSPEEKFGKIMSWTDEMILLGFELCTDANLKKIQKRLDASENPRDLKMELAYETVRIYHNEVTADKARDAFIQTFQKGDTPDAKVMRVHKDDLLMEVVCNEGLVKSKTVFRYLVSEGAVENKTTGTKIDDYKQKVENGTYRIGKHTFITLEVKDA